VNKKMVAALIGGAALLAPGLSSADCFDQAQPWLVRLGVHNVDPVGGTSTLAGGAITAKVEDKIGPTVNLDYRVCHNFVVDVLGALPFTRLCVNCQAEREKEAKAARRFEDERAYRKLSATDIDEENT